MTATLKAISRTTEMRHTVTHLPDPAAAGERTPILRNQNRRPPCAGKRPIRRGWQIEATAPAPVVLAHVGNVEIMPARIEATTLNVHRRAPAPSPSCRIVPRSMTPCSADASHSRKPITW